MSRHSKEALELHAQQLPNEAEPMGFMQPPGPSALEEICPTHLRTDNLSERSGEWWMPPQASPAPLPVGVVKTPVPAEGDPLLGTVVGSFRLVRRLGGGGMGTVYLGEHVLIGSKAAVKFLHENLASNEALVQRFLAEARAVNLIGHENIINIFDMNVLPPKRHYLVMEYLDGSPLSSMTGTPQQPAVIVPILTQVCDALQAAHINGVVHRDLKPENIFLLHRERLPWFVKVLDFGIAKLLDNPLAQAQTLAGTLIGTPEYMAPEQWTGQPVDGRTDLYALGLIAYTLLTGRRPFSGEGLGGMLQAHLRHVPEAPHLVRPEVPVALSDVVMRAMAKRPEDRFQDATQLRLALERAVAPAAVKGQSAASGQATPSMFSHGRTLTPVPKARVTPAAQPMPRGTPVTGPGTRPPAHRVGELTAWVTLAPGLEPVRLSCSDLTRAGAFLCTEGVLPELRARYPRLRLALREDLTANLLARMQGAQLDLALIALPYDTDGMIEEALFDDEFWLAGREDDPALKRKHAVVSAPVAERLLLLEEGHCLREHTLAACTRAAKPNPSGLEATSLLTLVQMVESGLGLALLPEMALKSGVLAGKRLVARPLAPPAPKRRIALLARPTTARKIEFETLAALIRDAHARHERATRTSSGRRKTAR